jgi:hypothetical protein
VNVTEVTPPEHKVVLDPIVHQRIIADMARFCEIANVPANFVRHSMKGYCNEGEIEWVRQFNVHLKNNVGGLVIIGNDRPETRCMAIAGTLVRQFIDARIMSLNHLVANPEEAALPTVLVVPNLHMKSFGNPLTAWQIQTVYDVLLSRLVKNKPTVVCVENLQAMGDAYGPVFMEHLNKFVQVT